MKQITQVINKIISFVTFIIETCVSAIGEDLLLLVFLVTSIIPNEMIKAICNMKVFNIRSLFFNFAWYCIVVAISYNYKKKRSRIIYFSVVTTIIYGLTYANLTYYRYYTDFLSLSQFKQLTLFKDVADATTTVMTAFDIIFWVVFAVMIGLIIFVGRAKFNKFNYDNISKRILYRINFLRLGLLIFVAGLLSLAPANISQAEKLWNRPIVVKDFGLYNYHVLDIFKSVGLFFEHKPNESEFEDFVNYFVEKNSEIDVNDYTNILKGKNIIVIHAESLENFVINETVFDTEGNEIEITPNFNKIANEGLYFNKFYSQQSIGTSADSEFVMNTSLLPVNNGTVFLTHFDRTYVTTQNLLQNQGYSTLYMHGNNASFWNRRTMFPVMGYDVFIAKDEYSFTEKQVIGLGISDYDFFQQSAAYLGDASEPFFATLITLTNHTPWIETDEYITKDELGVVEPSIDCESIGLENTTTCRYFKAVRYMDWAFGQFMKTLKEMGILNNTAIVVYGDHPAKLSMEHMEIFYDEELSRVEYSSKAHVPFMIWDGDDIKPKKVTTVMAEFDAGPTLQNMLGIKNHFALGHDIFSVDHIEDWKESNIVPFVNGDWTDGIIFYSYRDDDYYIMDENYTEEEIEYMIEEEDYIKIQTERATRIIEMSNMINKYDLIAYNEMKYRKGEFSYDLNTRKSTKTKTNP